MTLTCSDICGRALEMLKERLAESPAVRTRHATGTYRWHQLCDGVRLDQFPWVETKLGTWDLSLPMDEFSRRILVPIISNLANCVRFGAQGGEEVLIADLPIDATVDQAFRYSDPNFGSIRVHFNGERMYVGIFFGVASCVPA